MSGILFLVALVAVVLVAYWTFQNDSPDAAKDTSGLLAIKRPGDSAPKPFVPRWQQTRRGTRPR